MDKKKTIGEWLPTLNATIRNNAYWHVCRNNRGTYASVRMRVLVVAKGGTVIAQCVLGEVWRGADVPHYSQWFPNSEEAKEATDALYRAERSDTSHIPCDEFIGVNRALPWELVPLRKSLWERIKDWACGCAIR